MVLTLNTHRGINLFTPAIQQTRTSFWLTSLILLASGGCSVERKPGDFEVTEAGKPQVFVVNYPLAYFAREIGDEQVSVHFPVPEDQDPAYWNPDAATINLYQEADLILLNGANYARWINLVSLPHSKMVNTSESIEQQYIEIEDTVTHQHGPNGEHSHKGLAFTTWLDLNIAILQARAIKEALTALLPNEASQFQRRFEKLEAELENLDRTLMTAASKKEMLPLIGSHPVYQYLSRRYRLNLRSVHWEPDRGPTKADWDAFDKLFNDHPAVAMLWEAEPLADVRAELHARGVSVIVFTPSGNVPGDGDFLAAMKQNVDRLETVFD